MCKIEWDVTLFPSAFSEWYKIFKSLKILTNVKNDQKKLYDIVAKSL